jgi:tRNA threonylcarbamoyl adenosine modification protein YjeE
VSGPRAAVVELIETTSSARATEALAARLARTIVDERRTPLVLQLTGDLGAGKTTFVRGFVRALPAGEGVVVQSPTFALARTYPTTPPVHHLDLYRLQDTGTADSVVELGLVDQCADGVSFVEWPVPGTPWLAPAGSVDIAIVSPRKRSIRIALPALRSSSSSSS